MSVCCGFGTSVPPAIARLRIVASGRIIDPEGLDICTMDRKSVAGRRFSALASHECSTHHQPRNKE